MITVTELTPPLKLSGLTSFAVTFPYNQDLVNLMKSLDFCYYHKPKKNSKDIPFWEMPVNKLAKFLDQAVYVDDIDLQLSRNLPDFKFENGKFTDPAEIAEVSNSDLCLTEKEINDFKVKPFEHQVEGINFLLQHSKALLLDSMGIGKSAEIIWYAETLKNRGLIDKCLVIAGVDSLRQNWKAEIQKFSNLTCRVLGERINRNGRVTYNTIPQRVEELLQPIDAFFTVINAATLRDDKIIEALKKGPNKFGLIAIDEVHRFSSGSLQGDNADKLEAEYKVAATGTLITSSPLSARFPLHWTSNDQATLTNFKSMFCNYGGYGGKQIVGYKNLPILKEEVSVCSIRRTLDQVRDDMPEKLVQYELIELSDEHRKFYEAVKEGVKEEVDKIELNTSNLLALMTRLRQATSCPSILSSTPVDSSKIDRCVDMVTELVEQGEKVVVTSIFKETLYTLAERLKQYNPLVCTGDIREDLVDKNRELFQNNPDYKLLLGTAQRMGTGFTLNAAAYMICIDTHFNYSDFSQTCDRIYRVTNTRPAIITVIAAADTVDERVREIVDTKKDLSDYVNNDKANLTLKNMLLNVMKSL